MSLKVECNLVILGVPEGSESLDGATNDADKLSKVRQPAGITCNTKASKRIGNSEGRRPILVVVDSREVRDATLEKSKNLKSPDKEAYKRIVIKKDTHRSVRAEWTRLHDVVKTEEDKSENSECKIHLDFKARKVFKNGVVIDQWNMQGF